MPQNVLFVLADQMRAAAMGPAGNDQVRTPTLDRMAAEGRLFERAYTPNPVCTPTRGTLLTGCYAHVHGNVENHMRLPEQPTVASRLRDAGYRTGYVGKWHLDGEGYPGYIPPGRRQGFEFWRGFNRGHEHLRGHPHMNPDGSADWEEGYQPELQTDMAIEFMTEHAGEEPFFCYLSWGPPHTPFEAPEEYSAMYDPDELTLRENVPEELDTPDLREDLAEYYALVTSLDDQLGRLLDTLDREGVAEDTLVVFASDHGEQLGSLGRQRKNYPFEESIHVPLLARQPGRVEPGRTGELVSLLDVMPTMLSWCDVTVPDRVQGEDLSALLAGSQDSPHPEGLYIQGQLPYDETWRAVRTDGDLLVVDRTFDTRFLFDTDEDPSQLENLAGDGDHAAREEALRNRLLTLADDYDDRHLLAYDMATRFMDDQYTPRGDVFDRD